MRAMLASFLLLTGSVVHAASVEIFDRATGSVLPIQRYHGRLYVAGEPGHEYELRVRSDAPGRVLAVTTVDGVNVITGETGSTQQSGYVLDPYGFLRIEGWRKSLSHTAAFYFTKLPNSYAARTGRPDNVGVIGVALFREKPRCCKEYELQSRNDSAAGAADASRREAPASAARAAEAPEFRDKKAQQKLGTGHGRTEYSAAQYTDFERASSHPDETIVIYYDSYRNLVAQGVMPSKPRLAQRPDPFPNGFVPDP